MVNDGDEPIDIVIDGITAGELPGGEESEITFEPDVVGLAQLPGSSFYRRFREKLLQLTLLTGAAARRSACWSSCVSGTCF